MNSSGRQESFSDAFLKNFIAFTVGFIINCINGVFVYAYFKNQVFQRDPRYILYIHLVINDMILLTITVMIQILTYTGPVGAAPCCILLTVALTTNKNSPLNLAGMAVERYIAVCCPLHHAQICTVQRAHALIAAIWVTSLIPALSDVIIVLAVKSLSVFSRRVICHVSYVYDTPYHKVKTLCTQVILLSFVCLTLVVTYLKVLCAAQAASGSDRASARNARNTILLHGVQLLICLLSYTSPFLILFLATVWPHETANIIFSCYLLTNVLPRLLSPLIYGARDKKFSSHIRLFFFCEYCRPAGQRVNAMTGSRRMSNKLSP
ncbi:odorant receptor 131-2-like [Labrus mixtus]|uniref:odorant receptor 131-2-like n=1 Tax=Labrus mixtus TaxID=508554 RepID=UPI0029C0D9B1|nr:odorant receptor 131-2-like [Labrus mixtus]